MFGLTLSLAILTKKVQHHITRYLISEPEIAEKLASGIYVDDFTSGAQTIVEGLELYQKARQLMKQGGFDLHKWKTNSMTLQRRINAATEEESDT